ncbi:MAG: hypothetical protein P4L92_22985 [Rudaea sp.]|nr:hypothetical protein [Rudaea sp.]
MSLPITPALLYAGLVYLAGCWLLARGVHRHARRHPHGPHRAARYIELSATPK